MVKDFFFLCLDQNFFKILMKLIKMYEIGFKNKINYEMNYLYNYHIFINSFISQYYF
jgi:hypothetical protein